MKKSGTQEPIPVGIDGSDVGFALRANPSRSGDKGDGGINTSFVVERDALAKLNPEVSPTLDQRSDRSGENSFATSGGLAVIPFDEAQITSKANRTKAEPGLPASTISKDSRMMVAEVSPTIRSNPRNNSNPVTNGDMLVAHSLKAEGFDASEDGTGRGVPLVPEITNPITANPYADTEGREDKLVPEICSAVTSKWAKSSGGPSGGPSGDEYQNLVATETCPTLRSGGNKTGGDRPPGTDVDTADSLIAFSSKDHGADAGEVCPTIRASGHTESHANAGAPPAIAFTIHGSDKTVSTATETEVAGSVRTKPPGSIENSSTTAVLQHAAETAALPGMAVRRLTPRECERLQGFPDDFTLVKFNGKPACDGPRYKAIGNSMAVPNIEWIGRRIDLVDELVPWSGE